MAKYVYCPILGQLGLEVSKGTLKFDGFHSLLYSFARIVLLASVSWT